MKSLFVLIGIFLLSPKSARADIACLMAIEVQSAAAVTELADQAFKVTEEQIDKKFCKALGSCDNSDFIDQGYSGLRYTGAQFKIKEVGPKALLRNQGMIPDYLDRSQDKKVSHGGHKHKSGEECEISGSPTAAHKFADKMTLALEDNDFSPAFCEAINECTVGKKEASCERTKNYSYGSKCGLNRQELTALRFYMASGYRCK